MDKHVYKIVEIVGSSEKGLEDAIQNAVSQASKSIKHIRWFEVTETRGHVEHGQVKHYQVTIKLGFTIEG